MELSGFEFYSLQNYPKTFLDADINQFTEDASGAVWAATNRGILNVDHLEGKAPEIDHFSDFKNNNIVGILDHQNMLWIATYNGLINWNKQTGKYDSYYVEDGLTDNEFNRKSYHKLYNGDFIFGGIDGIIQFDPDYIGKNKSNYELFLTNARFFDQEKDQITDHYLNLKSLRSISIPYSNNYLTLEFAVNDLFSPMNNTYQYKISQLGERLDPTGKSG